MKREAMERKVDMEEFKEGFEFEEKRRVRLTLSYINDDGSLEEIDTMDGDGAFAVVFNDWDKKTGAHTKCMTTAVKYSELDLVACLLSDEALEDVCSAIAAARAEAAAKYIFGGLINGGAKKDE